MQVPIDGFMATAFYLFFLAEQWNSRASLIFGWVKEPHFEAKKAEYS